MRPNRLNNLRIAKLDTRIRASFKELKGLVAPTKSEMAQVAENWEAWKHHELVDTLSDPDAYPNCLMDILDAREEMCLALKQAKKMALKGEWRNAAAELEIGGWCRGMVTDMPLAEHEESDEEFAKRILAEEAQ